MTTHKSASSSHYDAESGHYDAFNEENSAIINTTLEHILKKHNVKSVLDLACGTGSQVFWLADKGFDVIGFDLSPKMIAIAQKKAKNTPLEEAFALGDMRTTQAGKFDTVLTVFNAIGHLTKQDFEKAIQNVYTNLKPSGLYIFDIFNLTYFLKNDNITKLTMDVQKKVGTGTVREIQYSTINRNGILASYDIYHKEEPGKDPGISTAYQTLQIYSSAQLKELLLKHGFESIQQCNIDGSEFDESSTERILTVAKKHRT